MTRAEQLELEQLRRLVAAYRELLREAWRPVETTWDEVTPRDWVVDRNRQLWRATWTEVGDVELRSPGRASRVKPEPAATVRVLAPIPGNMTDLLLASELGAACARVDEEAAK